MIKLMKNNKKRLFEFIFKVVIFRADVAVVSLPQTERLFQ